MDPVSASLGVGKLISNERKFQGTLNSGLQVGTNTGTLHNIYNAIEKASNNIELKRLARQVAEENEDSDVNVSILQEVQSLFNESSEEFPPSVKAALKSCITRQRNLAQCRDELLKEETKAKHSVGRMKQYQISFLEASQSFRKSVLLFRQLIIGSRGDTTLVFNGDQYYTGGNEAPKEGEILMGRMRINTSRTSNLTLVNNGDSYSSTTVEQKPPPASNTSLGQAVRKVLETWSITFSAGVQEGRARWEACRGIPDTGCNGNWIRRDVLERSGTETQARDFDGTPMAMEDASNNIHVVDEVITLTWYRNDEANSTTTDFFIIDTGPYEMLLGKEFVYERLEREFGEEFARENLEDEEQPKTLLPGRLKRMSSGEIRQHMIDKANRAAEKANEEAQRRQEKMRKLAEERSHLVSVLDVAVGISSVATVSSTATGDSTPTGSSVAYASSLASTQSTSSLVHDLPGTLPAANRGNPSITSGQEP